MSRRTQLVKRRKALGLSQEDFADAAETDRATVGRWERGENSPQPIHRPKLMRILQVDADELDRLLSPEQAAEPPPLAGAVDSGDPDDMIRRDFLRLLALTGSMAMLPIDPQLLEERFEDFEAMNGHLWQVYQLTRSKSAILPLVRDQLSVLSGAFSTGRGSKRLCVFSADLFQLAGEVFFDGDRYSDAAQCYILAMSASREAGAYDLWACALTRHAYVGLYERRHGEASEMLTVAERIAFQGDSSLSTRHWVASVQAQAFAGLGAMDDCERALERAEQVMGLPAGSSNDGWLRFDGSRLAEERGARYVELGRLDLAEQALTAALKQSTLAKGLSYRRRGAVLADLAIVGAKRRDIEETLTHAHEAVDLARSSGSGYIARRLQSLRAELAPVVGDARIAELDSEIVALNVS